MDPADWFALFRETHEKSKRGELNANDLQRYHGMREELARSLVAAQGLTVPEGTPARKFFRVAQACAVELDKVHRTLTRDISRAGFSAVVPIGFKQGQRVEFSMVLSRGADPLTGSAEIVAAPKQGSLLRASFTFGTLPDAEGERLESMLFDAVLARIK